MRSPYLAAIPAAVALAAGLVRWALQGSGNLYTATSRRAYVPDPDLGWRVVEDGPPWLGLEVLGIVLAIVVGVLAGAYLVRRLERTRPRAGLRVALWAAGVLPLALPAWAFAGGFGPAGARDTLPATATGLAAGEGIDGALDAPAGRWTVLAHPGSSITARVSAGGEAFDARFARGIEGHWTADPGDLDAPMTVAVEVPTAAVDTGIELRTKSAREDYLQASRHPRLTFTLDRLLAAAPVEGGRIAWRAAGTIGMVGRTHPVEVTGVLRVLDDGARGRLGIAAPHAMLAEADLRIPIADTALAPDAGDFDGDHIPVHVSLVLVHDPPQLTQE